MLSTASIYALRAMSCLAEYPDEPLTSKDIADKVGIHSEYLAKVLGVLSRAGLIHSRRGRGGGFALRKSPDEMTILEIVRATEPISRFEQWPLEGPNSCQELEGLRHLINLAIRDVEQRFASTSLARVLRDGHNSTTGSTIGGSQ